MQIEVKKKQTKIIDRAAYEPSAFLNVPPSGFVNWLICVN